MYEEQEKNTKEEKKKKENPFFKKVEKKKKVKTSDPKNLKKEKLEKKEIEPEIEKTEEIEETPKKILTFKADWQSILIKLGIFLTVAFVIIFTVTKIKNSSEKNSFTSNMEKMKEVAYIYYKVEKNRPKVLNEEVLMTLKDMEDGNLIKELVDKKKNVCSKEYSHVSLTRKKDDTYSLKVYLSCGGEAQTATYDVLYKEEEKTKQITLYELKRKVETTTEYSCPNGYIRSGKYCITSNTEVIDATPNYRITPEKNTKATYKSGDTEYIYTDPIITKQTDKLKCPKDYSLNNGKCEKNGTVLYHTINNYTCPNGGTPSGSRCLFTTKTTYSEEKKYCKKGIEINGQCYLSEDYEVKCIHGYKDSKKNACYITYRPNETLSDWLLDGKVTYNKNIKLKESETVRYEVEEYLSNNKIKYKKYIKKTILTCDENDIKQGNLCRHYEPTYEERYCSNSSYTLDKEQKECYRYEPMETKQTTATYTCPTGYKSKGSGSNKTCYKYESAVKNVEKTPYCSSNYDLTSDKRCVNVVEPTIEEGDIIYTCKEGYTKKGTGSNTTCYKKETSESYYYCKNSEATLEGDRCIIPSVKTFVSYTCKKGYELSGTKCIKENSDKILATIKEVPTTEEETIWNESKKISGWTWTGNTKIEEIKE